MAKCYYAKRKLVWEILEAGLKSKIEIKWDDICWLYCSLPRQGTATLKIALASKPAFFKESDPEPRKHTVWKKCEDFTGEQATTARTHHLLFPPGVLPKHYHKLIKCDERLRQLAEASKVRPGRGGRGGAAGTDSLSLSRPPTSPPSRTSTASQRSSSSPTAAPRPHPSLRRSPPSSRAPATTARTPRALVGRPRSPAGGDLSIRLLLTGLRPA